MPSVPRPTAPRRSSLYRWSLCIGAALLSIAAASCRDRVYHPALGDPLSVPDELAETVANSDDFRSPGWFDSLVSGSDDHGQSYDDFAERRKAWGAGGGEAIYIQPFGEFDEAGAPAFETLQQYAEIYFQMPVKVVKPIVEPDRKMHSRINENNQKHQVRTDDLLDYLSDRKPDDAVAMVGVTMTDLYPEPRMNFVFGQARPFESLAMFSFHRTVDRDDPTATLRLHLNTLTHAVGHALGLRHCSYFVCNMNGANTRTAIERRPLHLGPVDLRKLYHVESFDPGERYRQLAAFYEDHDLPAQASWAENRLQ